jgi:hypothetical protein
MPSFIALLLCSQPHRLLKKLSFLFFFLVIITERGEALPNAHYLHLP